MTDQMRWNLGAALAGLGFLIGGAALIAVGVDVGGLLYIPGVVCSVGGLIGLGSELMRRPG